MSRKRRAGSNPASANALHPIAMLSTSGVPCSFQVQRRESGGLSHSQNGRDEQVFDGLIQPLRHVDVSLRCGERLVLHQALYTSRGRN